MVLFSAIGVWAAILILTVVRVHAAVLPSLPTWAYTRDTRADRLQDYKINKMLISLVDSAVLKWDFLLYGDSITVFHMRNRTVFEKHFGQYNAAPLGVGGNTVEELTWRFMANGETPKIAPKNIALLIGFNNLKLTRTDPVDKMDFLLEYLGLVMPSTRIFLMALLPTTAKGVNIEATNTEYKKLAKKHGAIWAACGQTLDPSSLSLFMDGVHPKPEGHDVILRCLREKVFPQ